MVAAVEIVKKGTERQETLLNIIKHRKTLGQEDSK